MASNVNSATPPAPPGTPPASPTNTQTITPNTTNTTPPANQTANPTNSSPIAALQISRSYHKLPAFITAPIKPFYEGTVSRFFQFLFQLRERRSICPFWAPATYIHGVDLLDQFITQDLDQILPLLALCWTSHFHSKVFEPGTDACASQLLYLLLSQSIKVNICRKVSQQLRRYPDLQGDGTAFWLCLTRVVFPNTDIFESSVKTHIRQLEIRHFHDMNQYITEVEDLIQLLGHCSTSELLPDLFRQLKSLPRYYFTKAISDLKQQYY